MRLGDYGEIIEGVDDEKRKRVTNEGNLNAVEMSKADKIEETK
jgi:hypothetical protein